MSDYYKKRVEYINKWPDSTPFNAELEYKKLCDAFKENNGRLPFTPMKMWLSPDAIYNRVLSHIIECLEVIPYEPNHAFNYLFISFDYFSKEKYKGNTTENLKFFCDTILSVNNNAIIDNIIEEIFSSTPLNICKFLYKKLSYSNKDKNGNEKNKELNRIITNANNKKIQANEELLMDIIKQYDYSNDSDRRKAARLYQIIFRNKTININNKEVRINNKFRLSLLLLGVIYSLRNDALHGSAMSSTKSSKTDIDRYANNYYSFLSIYTLLMVLLIEGSFSDEKKKETYYNELLKVTESNIADFKLLFHRHLE